MEFFNKPRPSITTYTLKFDGPRSYFVPVKPKTDESPTHQDSGVSYNPKRKTFSTPLKFKISNNGSTRFIRATHSNKI